MDRALTRSEMRRLMSLLQLPASMFGNLALMKQNFRRRILELHPDKGGDHTLMAELNVLWDRFMKNLADKRNTFLGSVGLPWASMDFATVGGVLGSSFDKKLCKVPVQCMTGLRHCSCIMCRLILQHQDRKIDLRKPCLVWGECFCFKCFALWFALPLDEETTFLRWRHIIRDLEIVLLDLPLCK